MSGTCDLIYGNGLHSIYSKGRFHKYFENYKSFQTVVCMAVLACCSQMCSANRNSCKQITVKHNTEHSCLRNTTCLKKVTVEKEGKKEYSTAGFIVIPTVTIRSVTFMFSRGHAGVQDDERAVRPVLLSYQKITTGSC